MRIQWFLVPLLLCGAILAHGQVVAARQIPAGSGIDVPSAIATDNRGFVYVAGNTTSTNFPVSNALEPQPPQGALEVSIDGAPFVNSDINLSSTTANQSQPGVTAVAASSDGKLVIITTNSITQRSVDGGVTRQPSADASAAAVVALAVDPSGPGRLYVGGSAAVYRSIDGGQSWQLLSIPYANGPNAEYRVSFFALAASGPNTPYVTSSPTGVSQLNLIPPNPEVREYMVSIGNNATATVYLAH
jgi:hypothetical protein